MSYASSRNLIIWSETLPSETRAVLDAKAFKLVRQPQGIVQLRPALLVRPIRDENLDGDWLLDGRRLLDLDNWELQMLYSMHGRALPWRLWAQHHSVLEGAVFPCVPLVNRRGWFQNSCFAVAGVCHALDAFAKLFLSIADVTHRSSSPRQTWPMPTPVPPAMGLLGAPLGLRPKDKAGPMIGPLINQAARLGAPNLF